MHMILLLTLFKCDTVFVMYRDNDYCNCPSHLRCHHRHRHWCRLRQDTRQVYYAVFWSVIFPFAIMFNCWHVLLHNLCSLATFNQIPVFNGKSSCCRRHLHDTRTTLSIPKEYLFISSIILQVTLNLLSYVYWNFRADLISFLGDTEVNKSGCFYWKTE